MGSKRGGGWEKGRRKDKQGCARKVMNHLQVLGWSIGGKKTLSTEAVGRGREKKKSPNNDGGALWGGEEEGLNIPTGMYMVFKRREGRQI